MAREQMNIVVVGHVDHGKSTVIGRLLADTGSLPQGKLAQVKQMCELNARPFEYAFLLDALKDEQAQGITIDSARCFFKSKKRDYIIIDAPGHIEFLKNMISGAARAEAAVLVIDAREGIKENSRRHGYMLSLLGIKQIVVLVNKMDQVNFSQETFSAIVEDYSAFLSKVGIASPVFLPASALLGHNIASSSLQMPWYAGKPLLEHLDTFRKEEINREKPFRFPVQDIYKFTEAGDDRRIVAGTVESGSIRTGDAVIFLPSGKRSRIKSIEGFNSDPTLQVEAGIAAGFTLTEELYIRPGEMMCKTDDPHPHTTARFLVNLFWMGKAPLIRGKKYLLKLGTARVAVFLREIRTVLDASDLSVYDKRQIDRHDAAQCVLETSKPVAFDLAETLPSTGRFVLVDRYEIAGGGIILAAVPGEATLLKEHIHERENHWDKGEITDLDRERRFGHKSKFILLTGEKHASVRAYALALEKKLFTMGLHAYYLGMGSFESGIDNSGTEAFDRREERLRLLGELARIQTDSGQIFIAELSDADAQDIDNLKLLNHPNEVLVVRIGEAPSQAGASDVTLDENASQEESLDVILETLKRKEVILDYSI